MIRLSSVFFFLIGFLFSQSVVAQGEECDCDPVDIVNICYIPTASICGSQTFNCGITLDHPLQEVGIVPKLLNPNNFGPGGLSECSLNLVPIETINNTQDILSRDCHIFYVGNYPTPEENSLNTELSNQTLNAIYNWSILCSRNLAIVPQAEAKTWGYSIPNENVNPNQPIPDPEPFFDIFNGPFGMVNSFDQGGTFQGVITDFPSTGMTRLAIDANGNTTMGLDHETSDLIVGDIGYFSSNGPGNISVGANVTNDNDRLACNIFALGCEIVNSEFLIFETYDICDFGSITSYVGETLTMEGTYYDTIFTAEGCDTVITTTLNYRTDAIITNDQISLCLDEIYELNGFSYQIGDRDTFEGISQGNCDSLSLTEFIPYANVIIPDILDTLCIFASDPVLELSIPAGATIEWFPEMGLSCYDCVNPVVDVESGIRAYDLLITDINGCEYEEQVDIFVISEPYRPNAFSPNKDGVNDNFHVFFNQESSSVAIEINGFYLYDRWGNSIKTVENKPYSPAFDFWDGRFKDKLVEPGVYFYVLNFEFQGKPLMELKGNITLIN